MDQASCSANESTTILRIATLPQIGSVMNSVEMSSRRVDRLTKVTLFPTLTPRKARTNLTSDRKASSSSRCIKPRHRPRNFKARTTILGRGISGSSSPSSSTFTISETLEIKSRTSGLTTAKKSVSKAGSSNAKQFSVQKTNPASRWICLFKRRNERFRRRAHRHHSKSSGGYSSLWLRTRSA